MNTNKNSQDVAAVKPISDGLLHTESQFPQCQIDDIAEAPAGNLPGKSPRNDERSEPSCLHHTQMNEMGARRDRSTELLPMERFENEGPSEQGSLFVKHNGCTCFRHNTVVDV